MPEVLSQSQIDALLRGMSSGDIEVEPESNEKKIKELENELTKAKEENDQLKAEQLRVQQKLLEARNEEIVLQQEEQKLRVEAFRRSDIYKEFLQAAQSKGLNLASEKNIGKWEELEAAINTAYPDFMAKLHSLFPYLSDKESKVCMLAKTGIPPSGIAEIMKVSRQNITNIRTRIHQKIQNARGDFDSFDQFIESLWWNVLSKGLHHNAKLLSLCRIILNVVKDL